MSTAAGISVRQHPIKGRALYASRAYKPGEVVLTVTPLLLIPSLSHISAVCTHCLTPGTPRACSRCHAAYYCNASCQAAHWAAVHGKECKVLQRAKRPLATPVRALVQLLVRQDTAAAVDALEGHVEQRRKQPGWADAEMMAMGASGYTGKGTDEAAIRRAVTLLCKIQTNAFHRYDLDLGQVGIFLEPTLAMLNHSCIPNALVQFIGRNAVLRAEGPIGAGEEVEISYTDYTYPLSRRKQALVAYNFECKCPRCINDMNVYQVCAQSPILDLNQFGLVPNLSKVKNSAAATTPSRITSAKEHGEALAGLVETGDIPEPLPERLQVLRAQLRQCQPLVAHDLWAVSPLPQILAEVSIYYSEMSAFDLALAVACLVATLCDPYRYVAPFHPFRIKGLFMIAKLLANTAAETAVSTQQSLKMVSSHKRVEQEVQEALMDIDQVSLCQMLLIMVIKSTAGWTSLATDWNVTKMAKDMLDDIDGLPGREKELSLIRAWEQDARGEQSRAFFEYAVVQQVDKLARLGIAIIRNDFGVDRVP